MGRNRYTEPLNFRVTPEMAQAIGPAAQRAGVDKSKFVRQALAEAINKVWGAGVPSPGVPVSGVASGGDGSSRLKDDDAAFLARRTRQLHAQGNASPLARRMALEELAARAADRVR